MNEGQLYVPDEEGNLHCLDAKTGKTLWKYHYCHGSRGSPVWADGKIYVTGTMRKFHILQPGDKMHRRCTRTSSRRRPAGRRGTQHTPAVANGYVIFATDSRLLHRQEGSHARTRTAGFPGACPRGTRAPAHLQIVPCDVVVYPGDVVDFKLRTFDKDGYLIGEEKADKWLLPGSSRSEGAERVPALDGTIADGKLTISKNKDVQAGYVTATLGGLTGKRVRVVPRLPYVADSNEVPESSVPPAGSSQGQVRLQNLQGGKGLRQGQQRDPVNFRPRLHLHRQADRKGLHDSVRRARHPGG